MRLDRDSLGVQQIATLDIETTHYDAEKGEVVAIGLGVHEHGSAGSKATYECFLREDSEDEAEMILEAAQTLDGYGADHLVTFNGDGFDIPFLANRLIQNNVQSAEFPFSPDEHLDLYRDRKQRAEELGEKWPSLEECLEAYGVTPAKTRWEGEPISNSRFGEELGPAYLESIANGSDGQAEELREVVDHYLRTDLENNFVIYYGDVGIDFDPKFAGQHASF
jgi:hypothetical protein